MKIDLPRLLWYGNDFLTIDLPDDWDVQYCPMNGAEVKQLSSEQMRRAIQNPLSTSSLRELARGKKSVAIVFDDMTRPTRVFELAPIVVEELISGGIDEEQIVFICALGTHGALTQNEFRKKLGYNITKRFRVFNHNAYENCVYIGTTCNGTKMMINRDVAEADLKIGISCVTPHIKAGFSGGGKLILPGIAHIDSISYYHKNVEAKGKKTTGLGKRHKNILREDIDEAATMAGMDFFINVIVNSRGFTTDIFAGDMAASYEQAVNKAVTHYAIEPIPSGKDLAIANAFVKANEMPIALFMGILTLREMMGTIVVIADSPEGQVVHHLLGRFGRNYGGRQYPVDTISENLDLIILAPHLDKTFGDWFSNPEVITWTESWDETRTLLESKFGSEIKVAVIPNATLAYFKMQ